MTISLTFLNKGGYLLVNEEGTRSPGGIRKAIGEIADHCRQHEVKRVAIDVRQLQGDMEFMDWFDLGKSNGLHEIGIHKLAIVTMADQENTRFAATVAVNRGATVKVFVDLDEAEQWIMEGN